MFLRQCVSVVLATAAAVLLPALPSAAQDFPDAGSLDDRWYYERVRQWRLKHDEQLRNNAREWNEYLDRLRRQREADEAQAQQRQDEQRRREEERQERFRQEEADRQAQRAAEAQRLAQYQAEQRTLALKRQAERAAEWQRWKAQARERAAPILTIALRVALPVSVLVFGLWCLTTMMHRYHLHRVHRDIEHTRTSTRRLEDVTANLEHAKAEADAFIAQEARIAYQRGRGL